MKLLIALFLFSFVVAEVFSGTVPNMEFTAKINLKKFVDAKGCKNDECIITAVADFLKQRVNVIDCGFSGPEVCRRREAPNLAACDLAPQTGDPGVVQMCKSVQAVGAYKGCSLFAAFMGAELTATQKGQPGCTGCKCHTKTALKGFAMTQMVASKVFSDTWGPGKTSPVNQGTQAEHDLILKGLADYWNAVVQNGRGVCASLAASLAFGSRMMGVKGRIEWVKETYASDGHEFIIYNRQGPLRQPTGGKIFDPWYYLLGQHLVTPCTEVPNDYYDTSNWNPQAFGNSKAKQSMLLLPLASLKDDEEDREEASTSTETPSLTQEESEEAEENTEYSEDVSNEQEEEEVEEENLEVASELMN